MHNALRQNHRRNASQPRASIFTAEFHNVENIWYGEIQYFYVLSGDDHIERKHARKARNLELQILNFGWFPRFDWCLQSLSLEILLTTRDFIVKEKEKRKEKRFSTVRFCDAGTARTWLKASSDDPLFALNPFHLLCRPGPFCHSFQIFSLRFPSVG